jgi:hypothetical protein
MSAVTILKQNICPMILPAITAMTAAQTGVSHHVINYLFSLNIKQPVQKRYRRQAAAMKHTYEMEKET